MERPNSAYEAIYKQACGDNAQALDFLLAWGVFCHAVDDLIDGEKSADKFIDTLALANILYSTDFYQAYVGSLSMTVMLATNAFADSVAWDGSETDWKRSWSDTLRFAGNEMVVAVAVICGGYERGREVSLLLREDSWNQHHSGTQPI